MAMADKPILLIDAKNALYRAVFAGKASTHAQKYHDFVIFLRQIAGWVNRYRPESVHVFWDAPRTTVWRRKALPTYKDRPNNGYVDDISEELAICTTVAKQFFANMNIRQFERKAMEADDLIYAAVTVLHPRSTVIVSSDSDMLQVPYMVSSCAVYDPTKQEQVAMPSVHPAIQKAITGDKSDAIDGYHGIGPKKSEAMLRNPVELFEFLRIAGPQKYYRNLLLIDLSLNPRLMSNKVYVQRKLSTKVAFNDKEINALVLKHRVNGLLAEFQNLIPPFRHLV